jgi:hypothetical protein
VRAVLALEGSMTKPFNDWLKIDDDRISYSVCEKSEGSGVSAEACADSPVGSNDDFSNGIE